MPPRIVYDAFYVIGAPWEVGPRHELVDLVTRGTLSARRLAGPGLRARALDIGCGSGANALFLAEHGFDVTGIDRSRVALRKARLAAARAREGGDRLRLVRGDLARAGGTPGVEGPFDLVIDVCTSDDVPPASRRAIAANVKEWTRPGGAYLVWCFYDRSRLPLVSLKGPSRLNPEGLAPGELEDLLGDAFGVERLPSPAAGSGAACFLSWRHGGPAAA